MKRAAPEEASGGDDVADPAKRAPLSPAKPDTNVNPPRAAFKPPFRPGGFRPPGGTNPAAGFKSPFVRPAVASAPGAPPSVRPVARPAVRPVFAVPARTAAGGGVSTSSLPIRTQAPTGGSESKSSPKLYFGCLYAKRKAAKNRSSKSWLDGMVMTVPPTTTLLDATGKKIASGKAGTCVAGTEMQIGNFEVEVQDPVTEREFQSGAALAGSATAVVATHVSSTMNKPFSSVTYASEGTAVRPKMKPQKPLEPPPTGALVLSSAGDTFNGVAAKSHVFVDAFLAKSLRPHQQEGVKFMYSTVMGFHRNAHTNQQHRGCLLAHEMGMGKTVQVISLIWALTRQGPNGSPVANKVVIVTPASLVQNWGMEFKKWIGLSRGLEPLLVESGSTEKGKDAKTVFRTEWANSKQKKYKVLITSFETLRTHAGLVQSTTGGIDLLVCDEAHRLKNASGQTLTVTALRKLKCDRRILLSGTPVQNDLGEFFAVFDFACPGILGDYTSFKKIFAGPVERSRDKNASEEEQKLGAARGEEIQRMTSQFVHRASANEGNKNRIPPKTEYVVFCKLTPVQSKLYSEYLKVASMRGIFGGNSGGKNTIMPLQALQNLQKLCNSASLLMGDGESSSDAGSKSPKKKSPALDPEIRQRLSSRLPAGYPDPCGTSLPPHHPAMSGKLAVLSSLITSSIACGDRLVVVSGWTSTLDVIERALSSMGVTKLSRLDGTVATQKRQTLVNSFNAGRGGDAFLLSTKAGGVGLNLIGANRLILFDSDWNPANDLQALARVWREGQKKPVMIYRLLATGTIEERIFQRQILKGSVANAVGYTSASAGDGRNADGAGGSGDALTSAPTQNPNAFSKEELRDLFTFNANAVCDTQEALRARGQTRVGVATDGALESKKREVPLHWRQCASQAEGGVLDAPLNSAMSLVHATPDGEIPTSTSTVKSKLISFCCALPSSDALTVVAETCAAGEPQETIADDAVASDAIGAPS